MKDSFELNKVRYSTLTSFYVIFPVSLNSSRSSVCIITNTTYPAPPWAACRLRQLLLVAGWPQNAKRVSRFGPICKLTACCLELSLILAKIKKIKNKLLQFELIKKPPPQPQSASRSVIIKIANKSRITSRCNANNCFFLFLARTEKPVKNFKKTNRNFQTSYPNRHECCGSFSVPLSLTHFPSVSLCLAITSWCQRLSKYFVI